MRYTPVKKLLRYLMCQQGSGQESFVDTLAALHSIAPKDVGLGDLGRPDGYVARQLKLVWIVDRISR